jgi:hypothetical protein
VVVDITVHILPLQLVVQVAVELLIKVGLAHKQERRHLHRVKVALVVLTLETALMLLVVAAVQVQLVPITLEHLLVLAV